MKNRSGNALAYGILAVTLVLVSLMVFLKPSGSGNQTANVSATVSKSSEKGSLEVPETSYSFGDISMAAGKVKYLYKVKNNGLEPVTVTRMYTSCMCTSARLLVGDKKVGPFGMPGHGFVPRVDEAIPAGVEAEVEVIFDPAAHGPAGVGRIERTVYLETNSGNPVEFNFSANVTP